MKHYYLNLATFKTYIDDYANLIQASEEYPAIDIDVILNPRNPRFEDDTQKERFWGSFIIRMFTSILSDYPNDAYNLFSPIFRKSGGPGSKTSNEPEQLQACREIQVTQDQIIQYLQSNDYGHHVQAIENLLNYGLEEAEPIITVQLPTSDWNLLDEAISNYIGGLEVPDSISKAYEERVIALKNRIQNQIEDNPLNK